MATIEYLQYLLILTFFISLFYYLLRSRTWKQTSVPTSWPLLGMLPSLVHNIHRVHDLSTDILKETEGTALFKGPWFTNSDMLITCDPANVNHILSKNYSNYPKSPEFRQIFDIFGDGIINAEPRIWELHRKTTMTLFTHPNFHRLLEKTTWSKIENGLSPVLERFCNQGAQFDLQDLFQRLTFDSSSMLLLDHDPGSLALDLPHVPCEKAFDDVSEALLHRHIWPRSFWKLQRWLGIGKERNLMRAWKAFDDFGYPCISQKLEELRARPGPVNDEAEDFNLLAAFLEAFKGTDLVTERPEKFLRDTFLNLMLAGRDTSSTALTWLFWLLSKNPEAESKIVEEVMANFHVADEKKLKLFTSQESRRLVYLHAALCESLRLFPPVSLEHQAPARPDLLPSGHRIEANTKVVISFYSMGRMETIWGKDCLDFRPERWISDRGAIKNEPSFKFPAFNAGPRACLGKEMAFVEMKMVAASILYNYHVEVDEDHPVSPNASIIIKIKHGLKVRLSRRKKL